MISFCGFIKKRAKITTSLKICYIKFYFVTNFNLYFMKGDCNIILYKHRSLGIYGVTGET